MKYWILFKMHVKLLTRLVKDMCTLDYFKFVKNSNKKIKFNYHLSISQEVKVNETFESKIHNFKIASEKINIYTILPGQIFSFWKIVGNPNKQFKKGRVIKNGMIHEDVGGGLCQLSGIIYYISLIAGLRILERHNHSVDIYNDETRFCPLGTDATLVYGYKDLRIANPYSFPIKFELIVLEKSIEVKLMSTEKIEKKTLEFKNIETDQFKIVSITTDSKNIVSQSKYKKTPFSLIY